MAVAFQGCAVAVRSTAVEVIDEFRRVCGTMVVVPDAVTPVGHLQVDRTGEVYVVSGDTDVALGDGSLADVMRCLRYSVIQLFIQAFPGLYWFHAGAVAWGGNAVLIPGHRGRGKSTLVTGLGDHGWDYLSDDVVPLDPQTHTLLPLPFAPAKREYPGRRMRSVWLRTTPKTDVTVPGERVRSGPTPVAAFVIPRYRQDAHTKVAAFSPAQAAALLLENCWNFGAPRANAVRYVCALAGRLPAVRAVFSDGADAARVLAGTREEWMMDRAAAREA